MREFFLVFVLFIFIIIMSILITLDPSLFHNFSLDSVHNNFCSESSNKVERKII